MTEQQTPTARPGRAQSMIAGESAAPLAEAPATRRVRTGIAQPFGSQKQKMAYPEREGYKRYWFNDEPGRIEQALSGGYTHVQKDGQNVTLTVDKTTGMKAYLMEIPQEWWEEDMRAAQEVVDRREADLRRGSITNKSEQDGDGVFYAGSNRKGQISIKSR